MTEEETFEEGADIGPKDDPKVTRQLEFYGARLDLNEEGWVWRVILYEKGGCDDALQYVKQLPEVKELWTLHTKCTPDALDELQADMPDLIIYR